MRRPVPARRPHVRGRTGAFERLARIPDHRIIDRLLRSRLCIWVIGIMLGGIVFMQVSLLRMNTGIQRAVATQTTLERQNATMQAQIARHTSGDRIRAAALDLNMIDPNAGSTKYLTSRDRDVFYAVKRAKPPSDRAVAIMANNGMVPGALAEPGTAGAVVAEQLNATQSGTPAPVATPTALPTPGATPVPTVTPVATAPPVTAAPTAVPQATVAPLG